LKSNMLNKVSLLLRIGLLTEKRVANYKKMLELNLLTGNTHIFTENYIVKIYIN